MDETCWPIGRMPRRAIASAFAFLVLAAPVFAHLRWETTEADLAATAGDSEASTVFRCKNTGLAAIRILAARPSCSCTRAEISASSIPPGGTGSVKVTFTVGERLGRQQKFIAVTTSDAPEKPTTLTLRITIAEVVSCTPKLVFWRQGEDPAEKTIELAAVRPQTIAALEPPAKNPRFSTRLETVVEGKKYLLHLKPDSTAQPLAVPLYCEARIAGRPAVRLLVYALVR